MAYPDHFQYLNDDLVGGNYIPAVWKMYFNTNQDPAQGKYYLTSSNGRDPGGTYGNLFESLDQQPNFDTEHQRYLPEESIGQTGRVDNRNGLNTLATTLTLSYTEETAQVATHSTTSAITAGVTQSFSFGFPGIVDTETQFSFSGSVSYTDQTSAEKRSSVTHTVSVPVQVPAGKVYEAQIVFTKETLIVPYTMSVHVSGPTQGIPGTSETSFLDAVTLPGTTQSAHNWSMSAASMFHYIGEYGVAGADSARFKSAGGEGLVALEGEATMSQSGSFQVKVVDVTDSPKAIQTTPVGDGVAASSQASVAAASDGDPPPVALPDPNAPVGIHHAMLDEGGVEVGTPYADLIEGGAGNDLIFLRTGSDMATGGAGDDFILATGDGRKSLSGGEGNDHLFVISDTRLNQLNGDAGDDLLQAYSPFSIVRGGEGDDQFVMDERSGGSIIVDHEGSNQLTLLNDAELHFVRRANSLVIRLDGGAGDETTDESLLTSSQLDREALVERLGHRIVWVGFFADEDNRVNDLGVADVIALLERPEPIIPTLPVAGEVDWDAFRERATGDLLAALREGVDLPGVRTALKEIVTALVERRHAIEETGTPISTLAHEDAAEARRLIDTFLEAQDVDQTTFSTETNNLVNGDIF